MRTYRWTFLAASLLLAACGDKNDSAWPDFDGDGYTADVDCDDENPAVHPGLAEVWYDGVDEDCNGGTDFDADGDGFESATYRGPDCDDTDATVYPGAEETWYDGADQNCDELSDWDADYDGFDTDLASGTDCNDKDGASCPSCAEVWYDGADQNCDGRSDYDADLDGQDSADYGGIDCDDHNQYVFSGAVETWGDGIDQNCDGYSDWDQDMDGHESLEAGGDDCDDGDSAINPDISESWYDGVDEDCDGADDYDADADGSRASSWGGTDCDDTDPSIHTGATETWYDGIDNDCDGADDYDADSDGHAASIWGGDDCDDADATVYSGVAERCDGVDNDCDGSIDEELTYAWYRDEDGDGYGDPRSTSGDCDPSPLYVDNGNDCDDDEPAAWTGASETCDGVDNDCNGTVDDGASCPFTQYWLGYSSYLFDPTPMNWEAAEAECEVYGYHLATVGSSDENAWLTSIAWSLYGASWWIGYNDRVTEDVWVWASGSTETYTNWASGDPDDLGGADCAALASSGQWTDQACALLGPVLCEAP